MNVMDAIGVFEKIESIYKKLTKSIAWKNMITLIGEEILELEQDKGELNDQLGILFSADHLRDVSKEMKVVSGYDLMNTLENILTNFFSENELYSDERKKYISLYLDNFRNTIKTDYPEIFDKIFLEEFRTENFEEHLKTREAIQALSRDIEGFDMSSLDVFNLYELEQWYKRNTIKACTLKLFDYQNAEFERALISKISDKTIYIKGENINEVVAYIGYLFEYDDRFRDYKKKLLIVNNERTWNMIDSKGINDRILVSNFSNKTMLSNVKNNQCIFVYGKNDFLRKDEYINLEKRLFSNLVDRLSICGFDHNEAYRIGKLSKNNYTLLMRSISTCKDSMPKWASGNSEILIPALVANQWLECDGDKEVIELLLGSHNSYEKYINSLIQFNDPSDPFLVDYSSFSRTRKYVVTDPEAAWFFFEKFIDEKLIENLEILIDFVIADVDPKFELPVDEHYLASLRGKKTSYSKEFKTGFIQTLIYLSKLESNISDRVKTKIGIIIDSISDSKEWFGISEILPELFEIHPDAVLSKIENSVDVEDSGLINLFTEKSDNALWGRSYYTYVLWTLEKALFIEGMSFRSIRILMKLMDLDIEYKMSNSPENSLYNALVAWSHQYTYSIDEKISYVDYIMSNSENGWKLLSSLLPSNSGSTIFGLNKPEYLEYELSNELMYRNQVYDTYQEYYTIALKNIGNSVDNLIVIYKDSLFFNFNLYNDVKNVTYKLLNTFTDAEKYKLYKTVYNFISRNRHFADSNWALEEEKVALIEDEILNRINFDDESYKFQYVFETYNDFLLHPVKYEKSDDHKSIKANQTLEEELRVNSLKELSRLNINWCDFIKRLDDNSPNIIGFLLASEKNDLEFVEHISQCLFESSKDNILSVYYSGLYDIKGIEILYDFIKSSVLSKPEYLKILFSRIKLNQEVIQFVDKLQPEYIKLFWSINDTSYFVKNEVKDIVLENYILYENANSILPFAHQNEFNTEQYLRTLELIMRSPAKVNNMSSYYIDGILKKIYNDHFPIEELSDRIIAVEIFFLRILESKDSLKYLKYYISKYPYLAADLIKKVYRSEKNSDVVNLTKDEERAAEVSYSILTKIKFSPTNNGIGEINIIELEKWCDEYLKIISNNEQENIGQNYLGRFLANTNQVNDSEYPQGAVKKIIEEIYTDEIKRGFMIEVSNRVGVRTISDGSDLYKLHKKYDEFAKNSSSYPKTQKILKSISNSFLDEYKREREYLQHES